MKGYNNLTQDELNDKFIDACSSGNLGVVKYLLTSPELKEQVDIHIWDDYGFRWACSNGYLEVVKYLASSSELKNHANIHASNDSGFRWACENSNLEIIKYMIFDMNIEETEQIKKFLKDNKYKEIKNLFKIRELNKQLEDELVDSDNKRKNKI